MKDTFFRPGSKGVVVDTCKGQPCVAIPSNQLDLLTGPAGPGRPRLS